jgi:hypothetical protein
MPNDNKLTDVGLGDDLKRVLQRRAARIRALRRSKVSVLSIAKRFGLSRQRVYQILADR